MTVEAVLDRGLVRGQSIWPAFKYQIPGMLAIHVSDREIIFGIYSGAYLHGYSYLREITYENLAQLVIAYDQAMAELSADEQRSVIDITAKRYVENQKLAALDATLANKQRSVAVKVSEVDAKEAALESDRQALATKITDLDVARQKVAIAIQELEAQLEEQVLERAQVETEITREQLIQRKAELDVIETGIRAIEIQAEVADAAYRLASIPIKVSELESEIDRLALDTAEVEARAGETEAETARMITQKSMETLIESELDVARAETDAYEKETELTKGKEGILDQQIENADNEITVIIPELSKTITGEKDAEMESQAARTDHEISDYANRKLAYDEKVKTSDSLKGLEIGNQKAEETMIKTHSDDTGKYYEAETAAHGNALMRAYELSVALANANIVNTMTHQIAAAVNP
jgi:chromosome segregation ATPase